MKNEKYVTINGQKYDTVTGLPVRKSNSDQKTIHSISQKTRITTPAKPSVVPAKNTVHKPGRSMDFARSKSISHFAPKTAPTTHTHPTATKKHMDIGPIKHPMAAKVESTRALKKSQANMSPPEKPASVIKQEAIDDALNRAIVVHENTKNVLKRHRKFINIFSISVVLLVIAGYFTYLNMPSLSVRVASAQAGIDATYPDYHPDGYSLSGPVVYSNGQVSINFKANTGDRAFVIKQSKSSWDSSALKNQIDKDASGGTSEFKERGLTIFTYDNNTKAAWINGGILYSITGNAPLRSEQIRHIATSLIDK